jgi:hypothetical protein
MEGLILNLHGEKFYPSGVKNRLIESSSRMLPSYSLHARIGLHILRSKDDEI